MQYLFVIESGARNLPGYFPDISDCLTTSKTVGEVLSNAREALELHLGEENELSNSPSLDRPASELDLGPEDQIAVVEYHPAKLLASA